MVPRDRPNMEATRLEAHSTLRQVFAQGVAFFDCQDAHGYIYEEECYLGKKFIVREVVVKI